MSSFLGTETYAIDHKGRVAIPAAMRRGERGKKPIGTFVLAEGFEGCLALYSEEEWTRVDQRLRRLPMGGRSGRAFQRAFLLDVVKVSVDAQGRITIPSALIARAGLDKEAVLLGQRTHLEIWNPERLHRVVGEAEATFEDLAEDVMK